MMPTPERPGLRRRVVRTLLNALAESGNALWGLQGATLETAGWSTAPRLSRPRAARNGRRHLM